MEKRVKVVITGDALEPGGANSEERTLLNAINKKISFLKKNPQHGVHIPKNRIPARYKKLYDVNNLWKINLPGAWRLIYTIPL